MPLFKRTYRVVFPTLNLEFTDGLRVSFEVQKDAGKEPNKAKIGIYNLSDATRKRIEKEDLEVNLYAGYEKDVGPVCVFKGTVSHASTKDEQGDSVTTIEAADGKKPIRDSYCSLSYKPGTSAKVILNRCANEMGLPLVYGDGVDSLESYPNGYSFVGRAADAITEICDAQGLSWSIQNNIIQVIKAGGTATNRGLVFSAYTGLIGTPERLVKANNNPDKETGKRKRKAKAEKEKPTKRSGWKIRTLLSPTVMPGEKVKVESRVITGWFRVERIQHSGDYMGDYWVSEMELVENGETNGQ